MKLRIIDKNWIWYTIMVFYLFFAVVGFLIISELVHAGDNSNLIFAWDAVTTNADDSECTDLAGYAIYRSREADNWTELTGSQPAYAMVANDITRVAVTCPDAGVWYWIIRGFDCSGNFSFGPSNVITTDIDIIIPGSVLHFRTCQAGDINCDGDVDGADLAAFSEAFGGVK